MSTRDHGVCSDCAFWKRHAKHCGCPCYQSSPSTFIALDDYNYHQGFECNCKHFTPLLLHLAADNPSDEPTRLCMQCEHLIVEWLESPSGCRSEYLLQCTCPCDNNELLAPNSTCRCDHFRPRQGPVNESISRQPNWL